MESGVEKVDSGAGGSQHRGVGRPRQLRACVGLVLVAVLAAAPLPLATQQEQRVVRGLSFDGNKAIDDYTLSTAIATSNSSFFASVWWLRWIGLLGEKRYFNELERSEEHTSELQSQSNLVCRLLLEKKKQSMLALAAAY